jgi:DNA segregation ATPase FtsK/SpoIIIE-like protein
MSEKGCVELCHEFKNLLWKEKMGCMISPQINSGCKEVDAAIKSFVNTACVVWGFTHRDITRMALGNIMDIVDPNNKKKEEYTGYRGNWICLMLARQNKNPTIHFESSEVFEDLCKVIFPNLLNVLFLEPLEEVLNSRQKSHTYTDLCFTQLTHWLQNATNFLNKVPEFTLPAESVEEIVKNVVCIMDDTHEQLVNWRQEKHIPILASWIDENKGRVEAMKKRLQEEEEAYERQLQEEEEEEERERQVKKEHRARQAKEKEEPEEEEAEEKEEPAKEEEAEEKEVLGEQQESRKRPFECVLPFKLATAFDRMECSIKVMRVAMAAAQKDPTQECMKDMANTYAKCLKELEDCYGRTSKYRKIE